MFQVSFLLFPGHYGQIPTVSKGLSASRDLKTHPGTLNSPPATVLRTPCPRGCCTDTRGRCTGVRVLLGSSWTLLYPWSYSRSMPDLPVSCRISPFHARFMLDLPKLMLDLPKLMLDLAIPVIDLAIPVLDLAKPVLARPGQTCPCSTWP